MIVGFTGTRKGMKPAQRTRVRMLLTALRPSEFHHGDCIGADEQAHAIAVSLGISVIVHPPDNNKLRAYCEGQVHDPLPYMIRNKAIVDAADIVIATPEGDSKFPSGTWATIKYARSKRKQLYIIKP